ncbi:MAG: FecR domain-containing protein [Pseudomonadota bacterium]|nr:FecR domain-containing protein [Pseudomonadota bacterium]
MRRYVATLIMALMSGWVLASDVQVVQLKGSVSLRSRGQLMKVRLDMQLPAPLEVRTGPDGMVTLRQLGSELNVGPNSVVILPDVSEQRGAPQKISQQSGRVLYSVERKNRAFSVETRHLVSVVKGTVFSVAAEDSGTQVSLLEGSLEVSTPGLEGEPVLLRPNESATRRVGSARIDVQQAAPPGAQPRAAAVPPGTPGPASLLGAPSDRDIARVSADLGELVAAVHARGSSVAPTVPADPGAQLPQPGPEEDDGDSGHGNDDDQHDDDNSGPGPGPGEDHEHDDGGDHNEPGHNHDGNNGHGDDDGHLDDSNPGRGRPRPR